MRAVRVCARLCCGNAFRFFILTLRRSQLQGFIFFGNATTVVRRVSNLVRPEGATPRASQALAATVDSMSATPPFLACTRAHTARRQHSACDVQRPASASAAPRTSSSTASAAGRSLAERTGSSAFLTSAHRGRDGRGFDPDPVEFIVLDLTLVVGLDSSALKAFEHTVGAPSFASFSFHIMQESITQRHG